MYHYHWAWTNVFNDVSWSLVAMTVLVSIVLLQSVMLLRLSRLSRKGAQTEERLDRLNEVITMLTETSELGFRSVATEMERLSTTTPRRLQKGANSRITRSARRGQSIADIAAQEQLSQSEVRLHLRLKDPALLERLEGAPAGA